MDTDAGWRCQHELQNPKQVHYCDYVSLEALLGLLLPHASSDNKREFGHADEVQFLLVHQIFEIMFQLHIHELRRTILLISGGKFAEACHVLDRIIKLTKLYPSILALMHTMNPQDFAAFRGMLAPASGAESEASRVIELLSGITEDSLYVSLGGRAYTFRQTLDQTPSAQDGRPKTRWWTPLLDEVSKEVNLNTCFTERYSSDGVAPGADEGRLPEMLFQYDVAYRRYRVAHLEVATHQIGTQQGTGHTAGGKYLQSVVETARFFPTLFPERWEQTKRSGR